MIFNFWGKDSENCKKNKIKSIIFFILMWFQPWSVV